MPSQGAVFLIVCNHPGGTNAIIPVCIHLQKKGNICYVVTTIRNEKCFERVKASTLFVNARLSFSEVNTILFSIKPDMVLAGTSEPEDPAVGRLEAIFLKTAQTNNIPSLGILDFWSEYKTRFSLTKDKLLDALPNIICVMDDQAKNEMLTLGFPDDRLIITGNPHWDHLDSVQKKLSNLDTFQFKKNLRVDNKRIMLFLSQPLSENDDKSRSYTEMNILHELFYLTRSEPLLSDVLVCLKLHPRENPNKFKEFTISEKFMIVREEVDIYELGFSSTFVIGLYSMLLVEFAILGISAISFQPEIRDDLIIKLGYGVSIVNTYEELQQYIKTQPCSIKKKLPLRFNATEQVCQVIDTMLRNSQQELAT